MLVAVTETLNGAGLTTTVEEGSVPFVGVVPKSEIPQGYCGRSTSYLAVLLLM